MAFGCFVPTVLLFSLVTFQLNSAAEDIPVRDGCPEPYRTVTTTNVLPEGWQLAPHDVLTNPTTADAAKSCLDTYGAWTIIKVVGGRINGKGYGYKTDTDLSGAGTMMLVPAAAAVVTETGGEATGSSTIDGKVRGDDEVILYADGVEVASTTAFTETVDVSIPADTSCVLARVSNSRQGPSGLVTDLGEFSTDNSWGCTKQRFQRIWMAGSVMCSAWPRALQLKQDNDAPWWGLSSGIRADAWWIGVDDWVSGSDTYTCCKQRTAPATCEAGGIQTAQDMAYPSGTLVNIFYDLHFNCDGKVTKWILFAKSTKILVADAWRETDDGKLTLIGSTKIPVTTLGEQTYDVPANEQFEVQANDVIGVHYLTAGDNKGVVPFDDKARTPWTEGVTADDFSRIVNIREQADYPIGKKVDINLRLERNVALRVVVTPTGAVANR